MKEKKQGDLSRLMYYAGDHKYFTYASLVLAALSALIALVPFYYIWKIMKEVLEVRPNYSEAVHIKEYGWMAVAFALIAMVIYIAAPQGSLQGSGQHAYSHDEPYNEASPWLCGVRGNR